MRKLQCAVEQGIREYSALLRGCCVFDETCLDGVLVKPDGIGRKWRLVIRTVGGTGTIFLVDPADVFATCLAQVPEINDADRTLFCPLRDKGFRALQGVRKIVSRNQSQSDKTPEQIAVVRICPIAGVIHVYDERLQVSGPAAATTRRIDLCDE